MFLAFFKNDGTLDSSYSKNGFVNSGSENNALRFTSMQLLDDDKIIVCGDTYHPQDNGSLQNLKIAVGKYNADGTIDDTFANNGWFLKANRDNDLSSSDMIVQQDGKIIIGAFYEKQDAYQTNLALIRLLPNGDIDNRFGENGITSNKYLKRDFYSSEVSLALQGDKLLAGGAFADPKMQAHISCIILRYFLNNSFASANTHLLSSVTAHVNTFSLFPNPAKNYLTISGLSPLSAAQIMILNNSGKMLQQLTTFNHLTYQINVAALAPGIYYLHIIQDDKTSVLKFLKQ